VFALHVKVIIGLIITPKLALTPTKEEEEEEEEEEELVLKHASISVARCC